MFFVYILKCRDDSYYIGHTNDLEARLFQHQSGEIPGYTSKRLPVNLVFAQEYESRDEAFTIERQIKGWSRRKKEALINKDTDRLRQLASRSHLYKYLKINF